MSMEKSPKQDLDAMSDEEVLDKVDSEIDEKALSNALEKSGVRTDDFSDEDINKLARAIGLLKEDGSVATEDEMNEKMRQEAAELADEIRKERKEDTN